MTIVRGFLVAAVLGLFGAFLLLRSELHGLIKREHPDRWRHNQSWRWSMPFPGFGAAPSPVSFSQSQLKDLNNPEVDRLWDLLKTLRVLYFAALVFLVVAFL